MTQNQVFFVWSGGWLLVAVVLSVLGLRLRAARWFATVAPAAYTLAFDVYLMFRGGYNDCVDAGPNAYVCHPTSYFADYGWDGASLIIVITVLSLVPLVSAWAGVRAPSAIAALLLVALLVLAPLLVLYAPVAAGVIAAAVAGPPVSHRRAAASSTAAGDPVLRP